MIYGGGTLWVYFNWEMYGISTDKTIGMVDPYYHPDSKSYCANNGLVYENEGNREGGSAISNGSSVTMAIVITYNLIYN